MKNGTVYLPRSHVYCPIFVYHAAGVYWPALFSFATDRHCDTYWREIRKAFYRPSEFYVPIIVVHVSYSWDGFAVRCLNSLLRQQPEDFVKRVVLASLDGQSIPQNSRKLLAKHSSPPLLVSVPYPVSVLNASLWFPAPGAEDETYQPPPRRRISVLFMGKFKKYNSASRLRESLEHVFQTAHPTRSHTFVNKVWHGQHDFYICPLHPTSNP